MIISSIKTYCIDLEHGDQMMAAWELNIQQMQSGGEAVVIFQEPGTLEEQWQ